MSPAVRPVGKRFLMRKSSNVENQPPALYTKKADALVSAREASRRRRARVVSGGALPLKVKKVVQNAQRRAQLAKPLLKAVAPEQVRASAPSEPLELNEVQEPTQPTASASTPAPQPQPMPNMWHFPRTLRRPPPQVWPVPLRRENVDACDPELVDVRMEYIMRGLEATGESMWHLAKNAHIDDSSMGQRSALPDEINIIIAEHSMQENAPALPQFLPTHVLALWDLPISQPVYRSAGINAQTGRRKVSLVAAHNLVLAAHCAKWFPLPKSENVKAREVHTAGGASGTMYNLPVVPLAVPHPPSFSYLLQTLYTHKVSWLLDQLVPVPKPTMTIPTPQNPRPQNPHYILETARRVAARFTPQAIVGMIATVIGLWQNAIYLGVSDRRLWIGIDWSYDMLLHGLAMAIGRPELVVRPAPQVQWPAPVPAAAKA